MKKLTLAALSLLPFLAHAEIITDAWITKDALTKGIVHEKVTLAAGGRVALANDKYYRSSEFSLSESDAIAKAEVMRRREIEKLQARLTDLKAMRFGSENK